MTTAEVELLYRLGEAVIEAAPGLGEADIPVSGMLASEFLPRVVGIMPTRGR